MSVSIRDARNSREDRAWIERAYREYLDDLAAGGTGVFPALTVTGQGTTDLLGPWFRDERSTPFVILRGSQPVGFALVQRTTPVASGPAAGFRLTEFFIQGGSRGLGLGRAAATLLFDRFNGEWLVTETTRHHGAVAFWRRVIGGYTCGRYRERLANGEVQHRFRSQPRPASLA